MAGPILPDIFGLGRQGINGNPLYYEEQTRMNRISEAIRSGSEWVVPPSIAQDIRIKKLDAGFLVEVGCRKLAFENKTKLFKAMTEYWDNPEKAEKKYLGRQK